METRTFSTPEPGGLGERALHCNSVYIMCYQCIQVPVLIHASYNMANIKVLVDSGTTDHFIHPNFVKRMGIGQQELDKPKNIYNINDTTNKASQITHYLNLAVTTGGTTHEMWFSITDIGREDVLLGCPWLSLHMNHVSVGGMAPSMKQIFPSSYVPSNPTITGTQCYATCLLMNKKV